jgi:hypothetical protein
LSGKLQARLNSQRAINYVIEFVKPSLFFIMKTAMTLAHGFAKGAILAPLGLSTDMRKTEEVESFGSSFVSILPFCCGKTTKFDQAGLRWMQVQLVVFQSYFKHFQKRSGLCERN